MNVTTYTKSGGKATASAKLDNAVFGVTAKNHHLLQQAYLAYLGNSRPNLAKSKKRGEVRGGGAKPWRQKGTGRARVGSSRNPVWTGGGVAFGPQGNENYSIRLSKKSKQSALKQALTLAAKEDRVKVVDGLVFSDGKTKQARTLLDKIGVNGSMLLVIEAKDESVLRATRNLPSVNVTTARYLSVFRVMNADCLIFSKKALDELSQILKGDKNG